MWSLPVCFKEISLQSSNPAGIVIDCFWWRMIAAGNGYPKVMIICRRGEWRSCLFQVVGSLRIQREHIVRVNLWCEGHLQCLSCSICRSCPPILLLRSLQRLPQYPKPQCAKILNPSQISFFTASLRKDFSFLNWTHTPAVFVQSNNLPSTESLKKSRYVPPIFLLSAAYCIERVWVRVIKWGFYRFCVSLT